MLEKRRQQFNERKKFCTGKRDPFFAVAAEFLPKDKSSIIADIGAGTGAFIRYISSFSNCPNFYLLDANEDSILELRQLSVLNSAEHAILYRAPDFLPFNDGSVAFIHSSHLVEHLSSSDLYSFIKEIDRVLSVGGIIVISAPLLWERFYDDLSHVRPYNPSVFVNYLSSSRESASAKNISQSYEIKRLVYRYRINNDLYEFGSRFFVIDMIIRGLTQCMKKMGFRRYVKTGYTLVMQKTA